MKTLKSLTSKNTGLGFLSSQFQTSLLIRAFAAEDETLAVTVLRSTVIIDFKWLGHKGIGWQHVYIKFVNPHRHVKMICDMTFSKPFVCQQYDLVLKKNIGS